MYDGVAHVKIETELAIGDQAPDFRLPSSQGGELGLNDFLGRTNLLLIFYIKDDTPG